MKKIVSFVAVGLFIGLALSSSQVVASRQGHVCCPFRPDIVEKFRQSGQQIPSLPSYVGKPSSVSSPVVGTWKAIVLLVDFYDNEADQTAHPSSYYQNLLFSPASGTFCDYYREVSYDQFDVNGGVSKWYRASKEYGYYVPYPNPRKLVEEVVDSADPDIDFSQYDNDGDGRVDALIVVHAGPGRETSGDDNDIHSHKWSIPERVVDGVKLREYIMCAETSPIGVFCHEFGHLLGLPDLYDYGYDSFGIGSWCLMAKGTWNRGGTSPAHPNAWCKQKLGWVSPIVVTDQLLEEQIFNVEQNRVIYKLWNDVLPVSQYFLVTNRQKIGYDSALPGSGLLIWHIDEKMSNNNIQWHPDFGCSKAHYRVALEQADGEYDLECGHECDWGDGYGNCGDSGDPFYEPRIFDAGSFPSSDAYSCEHTYVSVSNISASGDPMTADLSVIQPDGQVTVTFYIYHYKDKGELTEGKVIVDGAKRLSGYSETWVGGSEHTIDVISPQPIFILDEQRERMFLYSHWSDDGEKEHKVWPTTDVTCIAYLVPEVIYVRGSQPDYQTIQEAAEVAVGGCTIEIAAGDYDPFEVPPGKDGVTLHGAGMGETTIDGGLALADLNSNVTVDGFTFCNGVDGIINDGGASIRNCEIYNCTVSGISYSKGTDNRGVISNCIIRGNVCGFYCLAPGPQCDPATPSQGDPILRNCLIKDNSDSGIKLRGPRFGTDPISAEITNCTIVNNGKGILRDNDTKSQVSGLVRNCIIADNTEGGIAIGSNFISKGEPLQVSWSCFYHSPFDPEEVFVSLGEWVIEDNPYFADAAYHLYSCSPCVGAGDDGTDMGHFGGPGGEGYEHPEITKGDVNGDGELNVLDVLAIVNFILDPDQPSSACELFTADMDDDGAISVLDVVQLVNVILGVTEGESVLAISNNSDTGKHEVVLKNSVEVRSVELHISYDEQQLTLNELKSTQRADELVLDYNTPSNEIIAVQYNTGAKIAPGEGSILNLSFLEDGSVCITEAVLRDINDEAIPVIIHCPDDPWDPDDPSSDSAVLTLAGNGGSYKLVLENPMEVGGVEVHLSYNPAQTTLNSVHNTSRSNAFTIAHNTPSNRIIAVQYSASGAKIATGSGSIMALNFSGSGELSITKAILSSPSGTEIPVDISGNQNNPPDPPSSPSPQDGKTGVSLNTTLSWSGGDPDGDPVSYDVYFGASSPPPLVKSNHTSTSYNPGTLTQSTTYHWQVVARDPQGETSLGPEWSFTTGSCPVPSIRRLKPSSGSKGTLVMIYGRNFGRTQGSSYVTFYPDKRASIRKWRDTHIWCRVPAGAQTGPVTVTTSCGTSSGRQFTMAPPVSKKLGPQVGGVGQRVTLWGNQFGRTRGTSKVTFNNTEVTQYESWSNNRVVVRVPEGAISGPVTVNTGVSGPSGKVVVSNAITFQVLGDQGGPPVPEDYALEQNYPNPFNPTTSIQYSVVSDQSLPHVTLKIYNILGQEVRTLVDEPKEAGYYSATWDGKDDRGENVSSGIYFYSLHAGDFGETKKMVLMR